MKLIFFIGRKGEKPQARRFFVDGGGAAPRLSRKRPAAFGSEIKQ
jgi:hypothetical protein